MAALLSSLIACQSPAGRFSQRAAALGLGAEVITGTAFQHIVYGQAHRPSRTLHVYLDGDGTPWFGARAASDPTPRSTFVLELMALDPQPSLYLGRPCYHGLSHAPACTSDLWTARRYAEAVVASMEAALRKVLRRDGIDRVSWLGHSGGGTLAVLLAPRFTETVGVVTIAANLDIDAWAAVHGYGHLVGSLNPASHPPMPSRFYQRHYAGAKDRIVPPEIVAAGNVPSDTVVVVEAFDHHCCWTRIWRHILGDLDRGTQSAPPAR